MDTEPPGEALCQRIGASGPVSTSARRLHTELFSGFGGDLCKPEASRLGTGVRGLRLSLEGEMSHLESQGSQGLLQSKRRLVAGQASSASF